MKEQLEKRLSELKEEYTSGQKLMTELEEKQANLRTTLLRISGAIQILEETLQGEKEGKKEELKGTIPEEELASV